MKVLVVEPLTFPYVKEVDGNLEEMQEIVGGTIQAIYPFKNPEIALICNDDGKLLNLPPNRALFDSDGKLYDVVCGTFFLCAAPLGSEKFESLTNDQISTYQDYFKSIEIYLCD